MSEIKRTMNVARSISSEKPISISNDAPGIEIINVTGITSFRLLGRRKTVFHPFRLKKEATATALGVPPGPMAGDIIYLNGGNVNIF